MFSTSLITFIKGRNRHHMKNNIRYKGKINNTSVIIFFFFFKKIESQKLLAMVLCLGEPPRRFLLTFHFCIFILLLFFICCFSLFTFAFRTSSITLPWTIAGFLHPFYTFSPAHCRVIHDTTVLSGRFLPTGVFYLICSFTYIFDSPCVYQGLPGAGSSSLTFVGLHTLRFRIIVPPRLLIF